MKKKNYLMKVFCKQSVGYVNCANFKFVNIEKGFDKLLDYFKLNKELKDVIVSVYKNNEDEEVFRQRLFLENGKVGLSINYFNELK